MELCIAIIATVISLVALGLSFYQIYLSNKQQLFDRRLNCFFRVKEIFVASLNYFENKESLECESDYLIRVKMIYKILTNNDFLLDIRYELSHIFKNENRNKVNKKIEELNELKIECELIFKTKETKNICCFIQNYTSLLKGVINFQLFYNRIKYYEERFDNGYFIDVEEKLSDEEKAEKEKCKKDIEASSCSLIESINLIQEKNDLSKLKKKIKLV